MSDIVVIASRTPDPDRGLVQIIEQLGHRLSGGAVLPRRHNLVRDQGWAVVACLSASPATLEHGTSFCSGALRHPQSDWWRTGSAAPDGSYALVRANQDMIECLSDFTGSRSIWVFADADRFVASTSERAVIALLGSFQPNSALVPWLLSAGNPGAEHAWDRRIRMLPPNRRLVLERSRWRLSETPAVEAAARGERQPQDDVPILDELRQILRDMQTSSPPWALALSGGCDSRAILGMLPESNWTTIAWGRAASRLEPGSDLYVAERLARLSGTHHHLLPLDLAADVEGMLEQFVAHSEGRSDHLSGYIDGFRVWRHIVELGIDGVIRGDELFGSQRAVTEALSRANMGLATFADYATTRDTRALSRLFQQSPEPALQRRHNESLPAWRNRLRAEHEQPMVLATLNQVRSRYVEMANPLLFGRLVRAAQSWADDRTINKRYFTALVRDLMPNMPFAARPSIMSRDQLYADSRFRQLLLDHVDSEACRGLLPRELRQQLARELRGSGSHIARAMRKAGIKLRRSVALRERRFSLRGALPVFDLRDLALRSLIVHQAKLLLSDDANFMAACNHSSSLNRAQADVRGGERVAAAG